MNQYNIGANGIGILTFPGLFLSRSHTCSPIGSASPPKHTKLWWLLVISNMTMVVCLIGLLIVAVIGDK